MNRILSALCILPALLHSPAVADSFVPRRDLGVAALDAGRGTVQWEVFEKDDLPVASSGPTAAAAHRLLAWDENADYAAGGFYGTRWPLAIDNAFCVTCNGDAGLLRLYKVDKEPNELLAQAQFRKAAAKVKIPGGRFGRLVVVFGDDGVLKAYDTARGGNPWPAAWEYDAGLGRRGVADSLPPDTSVHVQAEGERLWLVEPARLRALDEKGRCVLDVPLKLPGGSVVWKWIWFGVPPRLAVRGDRAYVSFGQGLCAVDIAAGKQLWAYETGRGPFPGRVELPRDDVVLVQVGSDTPEAISGCFEPSHRMPKLQSDDPWQAVAAAQLLRAYGDGYRRRSMRDWAARHRTEKSSPQEKQAAARVAELAEGWVLHRDRARLVAACLKALAGAAGDSPPGDPSRHPRLVWAVLQELAMGHCVDAFGGIGTNRAFPEFTRRGGWLPLGDQQARDLRTLCEQTLQQGPGDLQPFAASLLLRLAEADARQAEQDVRTLLRHGKAPVRKWGMWQAARADMRALLLEHARQASEDEQIDALFLLSRKMPEALSKAEESYWLETLTARPAMTCYVIRSAWRTAPPKEFRAPVVRHLKAEIAAPAAIEAGTQPEYNLGAALDVLNLWADPADVDLLLAYLKHPCSQKSQRSTAGGSRAIRIYPIRGRVAAMLKARGVTFPPPVLEESL